MPELNFLVEAAHPVPYAATPQLALSIRIENAQPEEQIQSIALNCQIQIEAPRRPYTASEQSGLLDLFGQPERWGQTLRGLLWTQASTTVRPFRGVTTTDLPVQCTFDFNVAATKYFHALEGGEVPLCLLFSGTVFYEAPQRGLQVAQIPWSSEARYRMPVAIWKQVIGMYYPNTAWLALRQEVFDRLHEYKMRQGVATWEEALESLLQNCSERVLT